MTLVVWVIRPRLGAIWLTGLGGLLIFTSALYNILVRQSETHLVIPVGDAFLRPRPGLSFYLLLFTGIATFLCGLLALWAFARRKSGSSLAALASAVAGLNRDADEQHGDEEEGDDDNDARRDALQLSGVRTTYVASGSGERAGEAEQRGGRQWAKS